MIPRSIFHLTLICMVFFVTFKHGVCAGRRPVYIVAHMVNSIMEITPFLDEGANALESDIRFYPNGTIKELYRGCPDYCFRVCDNRVQVPEYMQYLRRITDPYWVNSYYDKLIVQIFHLRVSETSDKDLCGREVARHILEHLWTDGHREQEIRVLIYIESVDDKDAISGFLQEFHDRGQEHRLKDIGFNGGVGDISDIENMFTELQIDNVLFSDGTSYCYNPFRDDQRLKDAVSARDTRGLIKKVYEWTVDSIFRMKTALDLGVDGFLTNTPRNVVQVLREPNYEQRFRIATISDPPFARFEG